MVLIYEPMLEKITCNDAREGFMAKEGASSMDLEAAFKKYGEGMQIILEGARAETGQTPKEVIWAKNKAKLYHYEPMVQKRYPVPLLLVYALINRPYVLDLMPGNSFVEYRGTGIDGCP